MDNPATDDNTGSKSLWQEFYDLDPADARAGERFIHEHRLIAGSDTLGEAKHVLDVRGLGVVVPMHPQWGVSSRRLPTARDLMRAGSLAELHPVFVKAIDETMKWLGNRIKGTSEFELFERLGPLNAMLGDCHPRLVLDGKSWRLVLEMPGPDKGYVTVGDIYFSFVQDLADARVGRCAKCGRAFVLKPKQRARREAGTRVYCSVLHQRMFLESLPERKAGKLAAAYRSREKQKMARGG